MATRRVYTSVRLVLAGPYDNIKELSHYDTFRPTAGAAASGHLFAASTQDLSRISEAPTDEEIETLNQVVIEGRKPHQTMHIRQVGNLAGHW
jgi:hypothetical protein